MDMKKANITRGSVVNASLKRVVDANQPGRSFKELLQNTKKKPRKRK